MSIATLGKKAFNAAKNRAKSNIKAGAREAITGKREKSAAEKIASKAINAAFPGLKKYLALLGIFVILFLVALPSIIWAALQNYFGYIGEKYTEGVYEAENIIDGVIQGGFSAIGATVTYFFEKDGKDDYAENVTDQEADEALNITASEAAERKTLIHYVNATKKKLIQRADSMWRSMDILLNSNSFALDKYLNKRFQAEYSPDLYKKGSNNIRYTRYKYKMADAVMLMSLYTVQTGGNVTDLSMSDYYFWLGQQRTFTHRRDTIEDGLTFKYPEWQGGVLPQYLMEQVKRERAIFGKTISSFDSYASAADLALYCDVSIKPILDYDKEDGKHIVNWDVEVSIKCRPPEDIAYILGLFDGYETEYYEPANVAGLPSYEGGEP